MGGEASGALALNGLGRGPLRLPPPSPLRTRERRGYNRGVEAGHDHTSSRIGNVLERFRTMVRSVGVRRGLVDADLDEVMQDVRIRLWQAEQGGKDIEALGSSYLYQVATTAALDLLRRRRARAADRSDDLAEQDDLPVLRPSPHEEAESRELAARIQAAVATLPPDRRVAVRFHLSGYDRHDIARALGWSEARARNLIYRGLEQLRRQLTLMGITPTRAG